MTRICLFLFGMILSATLTAQSEVSDLRYYLAAAEEINVTTLGVDDLEDPLVDGNLTPQMDYQLSFRISSILGVDSVVVSFGSTTGGSEIALQTLAFDEVATSPMSFERVNDLVNISLGTYPFSETIFCRVYLIYEDGTTSSPVDFPSVN